MSSSESDQRHARLAAALRALAADDARSPGASPGVEARLLEEVRALAAQRASHAATADAGASPGASRSGPESHDIAALSAGAAVDGMIRDEAISPRAARLHADAGPDARGAARPPRWHGALLGGMAAAVAASLFFIVLPGREETSGTSPASLARSAQSARTEAASASATPRASATDRIVKSRGDTDGDADGATAFLPLVYSNVPYSSGQLVRMEVSRQALASFGLTAIDTHLDSSAATVLADVLVGEDGLARAVRFVRPVAARPRKER